MARVRPNYKTGPRRKIVHYMGRPRLQAAEGVAKYTTPRPPNGAPGSDEAKLYSANLLYDPGAELYVGNAAENYDSKFFHARTKGLSSQVGPPYDSSAHEVIPYILPKFSIESSTGQIWPDGNEVSRYDIAQWAQVGEPYVIDTSSYWKVSNPIGIREISAWQAIRREDPGDWEIDGVDNKAQGSLDPGGSPGIDWEETKPDGAPNYRGPKLGRWLLRWYDWQASSYYGGSGTPGGLMIQSPGLPGGYSARADAGDLVTWSAWSWVSTTEGTPALDMVVTYYTQGGSPIASSLTSGDLAISKTEYTVTGNCPGGTYFLRCHIGFRGVGARSTLLNVDTGTLGLE